MKPERLGDGLGDTNDLSWSCNCARLLGRQELVVSRRERAIIREHARRVAEIAAAPAQAEKKRCWCKLDALEETRPLIFAEPENAWYEIIPVGQLRCEGNLARLWEFKLLKPARYSRSNRQERLPRRDPDARCSHIGREPGQHHPMDANRARGSRTDLGT